MSSPPRPLGQGPLGDRRRSSISFSSAVSCWSAGAATTARLSLPRSSPTRTTSRGRPATAPRRPTTSARSSAPRRSALATTRRARMSTSRSRTCSPWSTPTTSSCVLCSFGASTSVLMLRARAGRRMGHLGHAPRRCHASRQGPRLRPPAPGRPAHGQAPAAAVDLLPPVHQRQVRQCLPRCRRTLADPHLALAARRSVPTMFCQERPSRRTSSRSARTSATSRPPTDSTRSSSSGPPTRSATASSFPASTTRRRRCSRRSRPTTLRSRPRPSSLSPRSSRTCPTSTARPRTRSCPDASSSPRLARASSEVTTSRVDRCVSRPRLALNRR